MKSSKIILITIFVLSLSFVSCSKKNAEPEKINVIATIFPEYDWAKNIIGHSEKINLSLLVKNGVDLHSFQPSAKDIVNISTCDLFIYVGGESDVWVKDVLKNAVNKKIKVINLMETLQDYVAEEEFVEGMQSEEDCEESEEVEYDEHVWLSLLNAEIISKEICKALCELDSSSAEKYTLNYENYSKQLESLHKKYTEELKNTDFDTAVFCDRFPFRYLFDSYNLKYYAAFSGCSAETEASFETMSFLTNKINELKVPAVFTIETSDQKLAKTVIANSLNKNCKILILDSLQNCSLQESEKGKTYINTMEQNLNALKTALNK
ncbi:MAG: metal ABC transporter substrate-binding protein [Treponema sp.]|nr:metal ABC transporter substrate-binding protein [Treponema sp.]